MPGETKSAQHTPHPGQKVPGWRLLLDSLRGNRTTLFALAGWSVLEAVPSMASGVLVARALDDGFLSGTPVTGVAWFAALLLAYFVGAVATRFTFPLVGTVVESLRDDLMWAVVHGAVQGRKREFSPDNGRVAQISKQIESVRKSSSALLNSIRRFIFTMVATVGGLSLLAAEVLWLVIPPILLSVVLFLLLLRSLARRQHRAIVINEDLARETGDVLSGQRDLAAFRGQDEIIDRVYGTMLRERSADQSVARGTALRSLVTALGTFVPTIAVLAAAPSLLQSGLTAGVLVGTVTYLSMNVEPTVRMLTQVIGGPGLHVVITLRRLRETHPGKAALRTGGGPEPVGHRIDVESLCFAYSSTSTPVIQDLDLTIGEGEHLAVVGPSGTGKSTLSALLAGCLTPDTGSVSLGGCLVEDLGPDRRTRFLCLVPQEAYILSASLRENIAYLDPEIPDDRLFRSTELVGAVELFYRLGGLDAQVDPRSLSQGERQLIALVRAHAGGSRLVLLDEATCHLDPGAEARAERAFRKEGRTLVVIAHRLSSAVRADRVLLLDGDRRWSGSHEDLLQKSSVYREMFGQWTV